MQFVSSLDRPLKVPDEEVTKLFGTNFDTCVINQDILEELPGEMFCFKVKDEGILKEFWNIDESVFNLIQLPVIHNILYRVDKFIFALAL